MIKRFKKYPETYLEESTISCLELLPFSNFITDSNSFNFAWICREEKNPKKKKKSVINTFIHNQGLQSCKGNQGTLHNIKPKAHKQA